MKRTLVFRADAGVDIGTGHVMRCLTLARAWRAEGGHVVFVTQRGDGVAAARVRRERYEVAELDAPHPDLRDLETTLNVLAQSADSVLVLDGYGFDAEYQRQLKNADCRLLVVDDYHHAGHYWADIVLNQNLGAPAADYSREPYTRLLLGPEYVLLRDEFGPWRHWHREIPPRAGRVLVTMGGSDPDNVTALVVRSLAQIGGAPFEARIVVGASYPHLSAMAALLESLAPQFRLVHNAGNMAELMAWADIAVSAGGTTCYELAFMGLPNIILVLADNQRDVARAMEAEGVSDNAGESGALAEVELAARIAALLDDPERRKAMSATGRALVDGLGSRRVVNELRDL